MFDADPPIHAVAPADLDAGALLALNNHHATELSWLDPDRLRALVDTAFLAARVGLADALLLAVDQTAAYDNPNFRWFGARYDRFVYVDRVVVAPQARIVCEINADPPNPASDAFHAGLSFATVGSAVLPGGAKTVRYLSLDLAAGAEPRP